MTNYKSYSIVINNPISNDASNFFDNLHIIENDNENESFIYRWTPVNNSEPFYLNNFTGKIEKFDLEYNLLISDDYINSILQPRTNKLSNKSNSGEPLPVYYLDCYTDIDCSSNECNCYDEVPCTLSTVCYLANGGGGGGTSGSGSSGGTGGSSGGGGGTGGGSSTGDDSGDGDTAVVTPNVPADLVDEKNPCDRLRSKTSNNPNYMMKFNNLNIQGNYTANVEKGFAEKIVNGQSQYLDLTASGNDGLIFPYSSMNFTHVHNNKPSTNSDGENFDGAIKIFSPDDLYCLLGTCQNNADANLSNAFGVVISNEGIFSISLLEPFTEPADFEIKKKKFEDNYRIQTKNIITETSLTPTQRKKKMEKMFLKELKDLGLENKVALFEGKVSNLNGINRLNWTRKTLSSNNMTVTETPCNL